MSAVVKPDRRAFIGGSDIGKLIGVSQYGDAYSLYLEKRGEIEPPEEETKAQRRGKILEPAIAELYAAEFAARVTPGLTLPLPGVDFGRAQIDFMERTDHNDLIPIEIKSASEFTRNKWGPTGTDDAPTSHCAQLHWQLAAIGAPFGRIVALLGADDLRVYTIERDLKVEEFLIEQARAFWQRVLDGNAPEPDFTHPSIGETLARLFKQPNATEILQADDALRSWRDVYIEAGEQLKLYEGVKDGAKAHLLAAMRNAGILDFGDGTMLERKVVKRKGYTVADTSYVDARIKKTKTAEVPALTYEAA